MKKIVLTLMAVLTLTVANAENENTNMVTSTNAYDMSVNIRKLGTVLGLNRDQMEVVEDIHREFCNEMLLASQANGDERRTLVADAVNKDIRYMHYVLSDKQFKKYLLLLNTTLSNRGLNK